MPSLPLSKKRDLFDFFPIPRILRMPAVGVDVSDESVKFIELRKTSKGITLGRFGKYNIPPGAIDGGEVKNTSEFVNVLKRLKEQHSFNFVHASLPEQHAFVFQTKIPRNVRRRQIRNVLEFKLEENVPLRSEEAVFDYSINLVPDSGEHQQKEQKEVELESGTTAEDVSLESEAPTSRQDVGSRSPDSFANAEDVEKEDETEELGNSYVATVFVYRREIVEAYSQAFQNAGIQPLSFEIETQASAYSVIPRGDEGTYMIVDFGRSQAGLAIVSRGGLVFTSTLDVGGDDLNNAIIKTFSVSHDEAERMKNERGFINSEKNRELFTALVTTVAAFKDELNKHYLYWHTHEGGAGKRSPIDKIILCGGNANLPGLPEYLTSTIGVPVSRANVWTNVNSLDDFIPLIDYRHSLEYATTVGLALQSLRL